MEAMRESWTDDRLDDLAERMDGGFDRVDRDMRDLRAEMNAGFERVDARIDNRFDALNARFDAMQRTMLQVGGGLAGALLVAAVGLIAAHI